jgi:hypothetical protein
MAFSQNPVPVDTGQPVPVLSPDQLDGLVAPIALFPDPLISQILVASAYPLEIVEAWQWLQRNPGLSGPALTQAAQEQNWDPSVQALVMFPDALRRLNEDVTWTTNLGIAFMNQQADVMSAIQRMRMSAQQSGRLASTPQQQVINTTNAGQPVVEIVPANPQVIYVPAYDPAWVWGPAVYYPYPRWYYPPYQAGIFFNAGISVGLFFGHGWGGWGGWGWHPAWGSHTVVMNNTFIRQNNFNGAHTGYAARGTFASRGWNNQYRGNLSPYRGNLSARANFNNARPNFNNARPNFRSAPAAAPAASQFRGPVNGFAPAHANTYASPRANSYAAAPRVNSYAAAPRVNSYAPARMNNYASPRMNSFAESRMSRPAGNQSYSGHSMSMPHGGGGGSRGGGNSRGGGRGRR